MTAKSKDISAPETLSLLEQFTGGVRSFAEREKGLERARQLRDSSLRQSLEERRAELEKEHRIALNQLREATSLESESMSIVYQQRRARIDKGQIAVRNAVIAGIQAIEGQHRAGVQHEFMEGGRARERHLNAANAAHVFEQAAANKIQSRLVKLEKAAVAALRGFGGEQRRLLVALKEVECPILDQVGEEGLERRYEVLTAATRELRRAPLVAWFSGFPVVLQGFLVVAFAGIAPFAAPYFGGSQVSWGLSLGIAILVVVLLFFLWLAGRTAAAKYVAKYLGPFVEAKAMRLKNRESVEARYGAAVAEIETEYARMKTHFEQELRKKSSSGKASPRYSGPDEVEKRAERLKIRLERLLQTRTDSIHRNLAERIAVLEEESGRRIEGFQAAASETGTDPNEAFGALVRQWTNEIVPAAEVLNRESESTAAGSDWLVQGPEAWQVPGAFTRSLQFGELTYSSEPGELLVPTSDRMFITVPFNLSLPLRLRIPDAASILLETKHSRREDAIELLNFLILGWLAGSSPGRLSFSLIDPVGLGESFAGLMHLADYEEILINTRIRTQEDQIERRLGELCNHMEKVIQMYLRSDYESITQYNEAAGTIAERYHFLVVADFPKGFTELAARRLLSIASAGARCGVFLLIHSDQRAELPQGFQMDDLRKACLCLRAHIDGFFLKDHPVKGTALSLLAPPPTETFVRWVHRIGAANRDSNRIEVPFSFIAPEEKERWTLGTSGEICVPIGRSGATKLQYLALGKGTCQHALIAGKTGSGKSTLFHIIISNLALWCDPDEVEFYLIDFKKGVEFKCYADHQLPHARVIAIESDREFGLSVLQRLDEELKHRGELFRAAGVQDVAGYRERPEGIAMPRTLLLIDEFQEFFTEDDQISQQAAVLLDRIVRQGRAFGIHAVLGSQTLGGAFTLARATLGQMTVRIALACNEADSYLIMDDSNPAPRLLTRPGEGIYNDRAGASEANSPFQVVWMGEGERDKLLEEVARLAKSRQSPERGRVVFEGNAPAHVTDDAAIQAVLSRGAVVGSRDAPRIFLGAPNAIKGPTEVVFARQSGSNLLIVGQREDAVDAMVLVGLRLLRAQFGKEIRLVLIDSRFSGTEEVSPFHRAVEAVGGVECPSIHEMGAMITQLAVEMKSIAEGGTPDTGRSTILFIPSLHRYKKLRYEEDFSYSLDAEAEVKPSDALHELICEGPGWGYHVAISLDSYNNVSRCLGRKAAGEFEKKVLFQMSAADSASLIDTGKASDLGLNRALFYDEPTGTLELFRPYAQPGLEWFG